MPQARPEIAGVKGEEQRQVSRWEHLAKLAVSGYLQSCLTGSRKQFFKQFAPYSSQWQLRTDQTWRGEDPLDQAVQIARYFESVREAPPQILIRTTGYTFRSQNLGSFAISRPQPDQTQVVASIESTVVPVDMAVAATDEDQAGYLVHFTEAAFGPMCRFLINYLIIPEDEARRNWAVNLPLTWSVGGLTDVPITEDRKNRLWTCTYSAEVSVDVATWAQYSTPFSMKLGEVPPQMMGVRLSIPSRVRVGTATPLYVDNRPADSKWRVDDIALARITSSDSLYAKRVGNVIVSLMSSVKPGNDPYASQPVQIVP
jgi:hypothetical protein